MVEKVAPTSNRRLRQTLIAVFLVSLFLRLVLFLLMSSQVKQSALPQLVEDSRNYMTAAKGIRENLSFGAYPGNIFGPGYPTFIAALQTITTAPRFITLVQILLSALSSAALALFAWELTRRRDIALLAGLMHATSMASMALTNLILSDSVFFFVVIAALTLFVAGLRTHSWKYFIVAGLLFGVAPLIRSIGVFFFGPLTVVALAMLWPSTGETWKSKRKALLGPAVSILLALVVVALWIGRDRQPIDPPIAYSSYTGMYKVAALTRARLNGTEYSVAIDGMEAEFRRLLPKYDNKIYLTFMPYSRTEFYRLLTSHPVTTIGTILRNGFDKANSSRTHLWRCLPSHASMINQMEAGIARLGLNYRVTFLSLIGLIVLGQRRQYRLTIILSVIYIYYAILSGFTMNTGSRIFLPGMIAWAILAAYPVLVVFNYLGERLRRLRWLSQT